MAEATNMYDLYDYIDIDELFQWIEEQVSEKIVKDIGMFCQRYMSFSPKIYEL